MNCGRSGKNAKRNNLFSDKGTNGESILRFRLRKVVTEETKEAVREKIREQIWGRKTGKKMTKISVSGGSENDAGPRFKKK